MSSGHRGRTERIGGAALAAFIAFVAYGRTAQRKEGGSHKGSAAQPGKAGVNAKAGGELAGRAGVAWDSHNSSQLQAQTVSFASQISPPAPSSRVFG